MIKINPKQRTQWEGLWYHPEYHNYSSATMGLSELRKFKGNIRIVARKNKYHKNGDSTPNLQFMICDTDYEETRTLELLEDNDVSEDFIKSIPDKNGERKWYTQEEVRECINGAVERGSGGWSDPYDTLISDFVDTRPVKIEEV